MRFFPKIFNRNSQNENNKQYFRLSISLVQGLFLYLFFLYSKKEAHPCIIRTFTAFIHIIVYELSKMKKIFNETEDYYIFRNIIDENHAGALFFIKVDEDLLARNAQHEYSLTRDGQKVAMAIKRGSYVNSKDFGEDFKRLFNSDIKHLIDTQSNIYLKLKREHLEECALKILGLKNI